MAAVQKTQTDYTVAWICALPLEAAAARAMLDKTHTSLPPSEADDNAYTLGEIAGHNVVITYLPYGVCGTTSAAIVAAQIRSTFPSIRFGLMVGIGGGVPSTINDIRLGDVVVSKPTGVFGGVMQYDYGKTITGGVFQQTGIINQPPLMLLNAIARLETDAFFVDKQSIGEIVSDALTRHVDMECQFSRPDDEPDHLYDAAYHHPPDEDTCVKCDKGRLIPRKVRNSDKPQVHYGLIASENRVMKDSHTRDRLAKEYEVLCFEMEAAGLMNQLPCLVVRGICDYCDSHKNKRWQGYAALTAAAYAKILLSVAPAKAVPKDQTSSKACSMVPFQRNMLFTGRQGENPMLENMVLSKGENRKAAIAGLGGFRKTQIALELVDLELRRWNPCAGICACVCHIHYKMQTPQFLRRLIGNLLVGYAGMSLWKPVCSIPTCRGFQAKSIRLKYCFPQWFVTRAVHITWNTYFGGPELYLCVQRRSPEFEENSIFLLAHTGNSEGVKELLTNKKIMPNDAEVARGCTPLHFAIASSSIEICRMLLVCGANPNLESDNGMTAIQLAWSEIFHYPEDQSVQNLRILFPEWQCLEGLELSDLHKIVLDLLPLDLKEMLQKPKFRSQVNCQDIWGRTALHWSATKANRANMEALILAGANPGLTDYNRETPLFKAVISGDAECVSLLLTLKVNVHAMNIHNEQPIHYASQKSVQLVELLAQAGALLECNTASTPLDWASMGNCVEVVRYLLASGVQKDVPDWAGHTPVFAAIVCHSHEVLELLLHEGVDLGHRNETGGTVLHCVARFGDRRTVEIMLATGLKGLDPFVRDLQGRRASEVLQDRIAPPEDFKMAFADLIARMESECLNAWGSDSEEFFDTLDSPPVHANNVYN